MAKGNILIIAVIMCLACMAGLTGGGVLAADEGNMTASVTVNKDVDFITVAPHSKSVSVKSAPFQFTASATYTNSPEDDITAAANWTSSDTNVAVVDDGLAIILTTGTTTITAEYEDKTDNATLTVTSAPPPAGGGGGGGGGSTGTTSLTEYITGEGRFVVEATAESADGKVKIYIPKDTVGKNRNGVRLNFVSIKPVTATGPPEGATFVCLTYDIGPSGSTFYPPVYLTFYYSGADVPVGFAEEELAIVYEQDGQWIELGGCTVDPSQNMITGLINHMTIFTVMARTTPASFDVTGLSLSPDTLEKGNLLTVSATVTNSGSLSGSYDVILKIDGEETNTRSVTLGGKKSEVVSFTLVMDKVGQHVIDLNGLTSTINVKEPEGGGTPAGDTEPPEPADFYISELTIDPGEVRPGDEVTVTTTVANTGGSPGRYIVILKIDNKEQEREEVTLGPGQSQDVSFTMSESMIGTYSVDVNGKAGQFLVKLAPAPTSTGTVQPVKPSVNWKPMVIIFGSLIVIVIVLVVFYRRLH